MKIGKYNINIVTQKLITSKKLIKNKFKGNVLFEKYKHRTLFAFAGEGVFSPIGSDLGSNSLFSVNNNLNQSFFTIRHDGKTIIGNSNNLGGYDIGGSKECIFMVSKKPNFFRRNMIRLFFGWKYVVINKK